MHKGTAKNREMQIGERERVDTSGRNAEREEELDEGRKLDHR